jgi:hypothetical protein
VLLCPTVADHGKAVVPVGDAEMSAGLRTWPMVMFLGVMPGPASPVWLMLALPWVSAGA